MKSFSAYLPKAELFVGVLIVLVVTTFILRQFQTSEWAVKAKSYIGLV